MSRASPTWSAWPWVSTMWVTPLMAAALSDTKAGLPVKNGSISTALPAKSSRKAEWPYQVICMMVILGWGGRDGRREDTPPDVKINAPAPSRSPGLDPGIDPAGPRHNTSPRRIAIRMDTRLKPAYDNRDRPTPEWTPCPPPSSL